MGRLSIEIPEHQHQQIKAMAALRGVSIKEYILERTLAPLPSGSVSPDEAAALAQLEALLAPRIAAAGRGEFSVGTMDEIIGKARLRDKA
jgi:hypothetical protein